MLQQLGSGMVLAILCPAQAHQTTTATQSLPPLPNAQPKESKVVTYLAIKGFFRGHAVTSKVSQSGPLLLCQHNHPEPCVLWPRVQLWIRSWDFSLSEECSSIHIPPCRTDGCEQGIRKKISKESIWWEIQFPDPMTYITLKLTMLPVSRLDMYVPWLVLGESVRGKRPREACALSSPSAWRLKRRWKPWAVSL